MSGVIEFENYESKLKMMNSALFLFGMRLYQMKGNLSFFDSDFLNTIMISSPIFENRTLGECCEIINEVLKSSGFGQSLLKVGILKDLNDFDLKTIIVRQGFKIALRFNQFESAFGAWKLLHGSEDSYGNQLFSCKF